MKKETRRCAILVLLQDIYIRREISFRYFCVFSHYSQGIIWKRMNIVTELKGNKLIKRLRLLFRNGNNNFIFRLTDGISVTTILKSMEKIILKR